MKNEAKRDWLHIGVFLAICFVITYALEIPLLWGRSYEELSNDPKSALISSCLMLLPAFAVVLTRLVTKHGWEESYLHLNLKGNAKYYALAVLIPFLAAFMTACIYAMQLGGFDFERIKEQATLKEAVGMLLFQLAGAVIVIYPGIGEELGWRGYLYPMLERRIGLIPAMLAGGVIWGLWHAPLTVAGHNFGQDYTGYPYVGILLMCVMCIAMGIVLHFITQKSQSIYPAALLHSVNNNVLSGIVSVIAPGTDTMEGDSMHSMFWIMEMGYFLAAAACLIWMITHKRQAPAQTG